MLVLSRRKDESIMIGDDIEVTVVDLRGDKIRLGITAPLRTSVHRREVYDAIRRENAAGTSYVAMPAAHAEYHFGCGGMIINGKCLACQMMTMDPARRPDPHAVRNSAGVERVGTL